MDKTVYVNGREMHFVDSFEKKVKLLLNSEGTNT